MTDAFLSVRGVSRSFGRVLAVDEAALDVPKGQLVALLGPSGCGKTTLLRLIGGLDRPDSGEIVLDGRTLSDSRSFVPPEKRAVVLVFQDFALFPHMDVAANIAFGIKGRASKKAKVRELLEKVGLPGLEKRFPHELSGGQQQRVALARALAAEPRLILLDEPFSNLDPTVRQQVREEVRQLIRETGVTALFVTHDQDEALSLADQVAVMIAGRILKVGTPEEVYRDPGSRGVAAFIGDPNFLPGEAAGGRVTCELGTFPVSESVDGAVDVMVRPEDIALASEAPGVPTAVVDVSYFGHDLLVTLRLPSGRAARARWHGIQPPAVGAKLCIRVTGEVLAFPVD